MDTLLQKHKTSRDTPNKCIFDSKKKTKKTCDHSLVTTFGFKVPKQQQKEKTKDQKKKKKEGNGKKNNKKVTPFTSMAVFLSQRKSTAESIMSIRSKHKQNKQKETKT